MLSDDEEETFELQAAIAALFLHGILDARERKARRRSSGRAYLCRPQLLPNPRTGTPWQQLYDSRDDRAFITCTGLDVQTFQYILDNGFLAQWTTTTIPRGDVSAHGQPRISTRSLDAAGALGLTLHYLSSTMREITLQQIFALIPTTVSCYLEFSLRILHATLKELPEAKISFPRNRADFEEYSQLIQARHDRLIGAFGSIDGVGLPVQAADDPEVENATYNGWKSEHFVNNILAFSPKGVVPIYIPSLTYL